MKKTILAALLSVMTLWASDEEKKVNLGGYGELHLNKTVPEVGDSKSATFDFHRFVIMLGIDFGHNWTFESELELEHNKVENVSGGGSSGYLILEQAYLQYAPFKELELRAGVMLYPMGLINENHEPSLFSTVERPEYHKYVLPSTWFGTGFALGGIVANGALRYDILVTEGLDDRKFSKGIRDGRQKGYKASLDNVFGVARLDFIGIPGVKVGGSFGLNENLNDLDSDHLYDRTVVAEGHAQYNGNGFRSSVEFANISYNAIDGRGGDLENTQGLTTELGYNVAKLWGAERLALYPFTRYSKINRLGKLGDDDAYQIVEGGVALHPLKSLAIKFNVGKVILEGDDNDSHRIDLGVGYDF